MGSASPTAGPRYLNNNLNVLIDEGNLANALQSGSPAVLYAGEVPGVTTGLAPLEICSNGPSSAEAWVAVISATFNNTIFSTGWQGSSAEMERAFNYNTSGNGATEGQGGSFDSAWASSATSVTANTWHYLAWTWDGSNANCYIDGVLNHTVTPSAPLNTEQTVIWLGAAAGGQGALLTLLGGNYDGVIAAARMMSGVLTPTQVSNNFAAGLYGRIPIAMWAPSLTRPTTSSIRTTPLRWAWLIVRACPLLILGLG